MRRALVGSLSGGKTLTGIYIIVNRQIKTGKKIISNIKLKYLDNYEYLSNKDFVDFILENYEDIDKLRDKFYNVILFLDEITHLLTARKSISDLNEKITSICMYLGKLNADLVYTAQDYESMVDLRLRGITPRIAECLRVKVIGEDVEFVSDEEKRIVDYKINILVIWEIRSLFGLVQYESELLDLESYYKYYDTEEMLTLDRSRYLKK